MGKVYEDDFIWEKQYETGVGEELTKGRYLKNRFCLTSVSQKPVVLDFSSTETGFLQHQLTKNRFFVLVDCGRKTHGDDDYYCDEDLVQRLVFDAKNTFGAFQGTSWKHDTDQLFRRFNATLRFVATMSGLTRWEYISEEVENNTEKEFGDLHSKAIDETWYKSAVIQHRNDPESFVYSVPFDSGLEEDLLVTGSYAVFPSDAGAKAPGCVVGFQFAHKNFMAIVHNITTNLSVSFFKETFWRKQFFFQIECTNCGTCNTDLKCYLIDSDGYIIVSESVQDTGQFFGEIEGDVMGSMLDENIFEKVTIYDYQAICNTKDDKTSDASILFTVKKYFFDLNKCCNCSQSTTSGFWPIGFL